MDTATIAQDTDADLDQLNAQLSELEAADAALEPKASLTEEGKQQAASDSSANSGEQAAIAAQETKAEGGPAKPPTTDQDKEPAKSKYAREVERQDRSWKAINERKAELDRREAEVAKRDGELRQMAAQAAAPKFTAEQYAQAADKFEADGKYDLAEAARAKAAELRSNPPAEATARAAQEQARLQEGLDASWRRVKEEMPEALDKSGPLNAALIEFIKAEPDALRHPNGPHLAAQFVKAQLLAKEAGALKAEAEGLRAKVKELEARTTVPSGGLAKVPEPKGFNQMTLKEQERELERQYHEEAGN
jgi:hypothetical protein